jgi:hypothetical protein
MANVASSCGRNVSGGAKVKLARTIFSSQMPIFPSRRPHPRPAGPPAINPRYLAEDTDRRAMVGGFMAAHESL